MNAQFFSSVRLVKGSEVTIERNDAGRSVRVSRDIRVRGGLNYRIIAHSRKLSAREVLSFVNDFTLVNAALDSDEFFSRLADARGDYLSVEMERCGETIVLFNLDSEVQ